MLRWNRLINQRISPTDFEVWITINQGGMGYNLGTNKQKDGSVVDAKMRYNMKT
jgi:hypothetical protein